MCPVWIPSPYPPMYFFLTNLSLLDLCYTTSTVPQMLVNICSIRKVISSYGWLCVAQLFISLALGSTECLLLAVMSFDRFVAICWPLHIHIMHQRLCLQLAAISWVSGFSNSVLQSTWPCRCHSVWPQRSGSLPLWSPCSCSSCHV